MDEMKKPYRNLTKNLTRLYVGIIDSTHFLTSFRVGFHSLYIYFKEKIKASGLVQTKPELLTKR